MLSDLERSSSLGYLRLLMSLEGPYNTLHSLADEVILKEVGKAAEPNGTPKEDIEEQKEKSISAYH